VDAVSRVAQAVLYEGHVLWPYRRSALKNRERWTFGRLHPQAHRAPGDAATLQAQTLLEVDGPAPVTVTLRFLHLVERAVQRDGAGGLESVDSLDVDGERYVAWDEATERHVTVETVRAAGRQRRTFRIEAGREEEPILDARGRPAGALVRTWRALEGCVDVEWESVEPALARMTIRVTNTTPWPQPEVRLLACTLLATHLVLVVAEGGRWISLTDPPVAWAQAAAACENIGSWPVLVGEPGERSTVLAAPIVLYDYPQIAPESPGDFFDATEIDEMLVLNVLGLTDDERREMAASDPRAREIVERCARLSADDLMRLHGVLRDPRAMGGGWNA
jgi:hypothetical protein